MWITGKTLKYYQAEIHFQGNLLHFFLVWFSVCNTCTCVYVCVCANVHIHV